MEVIKCPHKNQKHYAKGMCNHCYHKYGRNSYADACPHTDRLVYAKGKCQNCYLNDYNKLKRRLKKDKNVSSSNDVANVSFEENLETKRIKLVDSGANG
jgi:C4-type Zn-finger protein